MDTSGSKVRTGDILFYIPFTIYLVTEILKTSFYARYIPESKWICIGYLLILLVREILFGEYDKRTWLLLILTGVICLNVVRVSTLDAALMFVFIFCGRNVPFRNLAKITLIITAVLFVLIIVSAFAGVIEDYKWIEQARQRRYLGFGYALYPSAYLSGMIMLYLYLKKYRMPVVMILILAGANYWVFRETNSRLSFAMTMLVLFAAFVLRVFPRILLHVRTLDFLMIFSFIVCPLASIYVSIRYNSAVTWMYKINSTLGKRLELGRKAFEKFGISPAGREVLWIGNGLDKYGNKTSGEYLYVDNMFLQYTIHYGLIIACIILGLIVYAMYRMYKNRQYGLMLLFLLLAVHGMVDDLIYHLNYNIFWMIIPMMVIRPDGSLTGETEPPEISESEEPEGEHYESKQSKQLYA